MCENNNFYIILDKDRITNCNLDLFQFESVFDKRKCEKFIPKDIYELSICKPKPIENK